MSKALAIRKIRARNWKNFVDVETVVGDRLFLVGPNAAGKSNFLDMFRFLRDIASPGGGFTQAVERRGGVGAIRCLSARRRPDVEVAVDLVDAEDDTRWSYELAFHQDSRRRPLVRRERVLRQEEILLQRPDSEDERDRERLTQTYLEQVNVNRPFRDLASFFSSVQYLHIVPQLVREPDRSVGRARDPFGGDFLEQVASTQERTRKARLRRIQEALRVAVPHLREVELWRDGRGTPHLRGKYGHWRPQAAWQTEEQFSDGTLRLLGLLWVLLDRGGPLLLEEPELSLHPEIVRVLPLMFVRNQRRTRRQVFVSTHSPDLLREEGIGVDEVLLLIPGSEGTEVRSAGDIEQILELLEGGLSLPDIVIPRTRPERSEQLTMFGER